MTNVEHQIGGSLGLGLLVAVSAAADSTTLDGTDLLAHRISASLTVGAALLAVGLAIALAVRPRRVSPTGSSEHLDDQERELQ